MSTPPVLKSIEQVLAELESKHPDLVQHAEVERSWLWLAVDLRGDHNKAVRESIGKRGIGFIFAANGHPLPSGRTGTWAHHGQAPRRFKRKGKKSTSNQQQPASEESADFSDSELLAALT